MASGDRMLSASHDSSIKLWNLRLPNTDDGEDAVGLDLAEKDDKADRMRVDEPPPDDPDTPVMVYQGKVPFKYVPQNQWETF